MGSEIYGNVQIRSFIAVELTSDVKSGLRQLQNKLKSTEYTFVKWVVPEGIHLTLKFLGNIAPQKVSKITEVMEQAVRGLSAFRITISDVGGFPSLRKPRVIWVGIDGSMKNLMDLQQHIDDGLVQLGFAKETRSFTPHLTLARLREEVSSRDRQVFGEMIIKKAPHIFCEMTVGSINLMKSQLLPTGAVYNRLSEVKLQ